MPHVIIKMFPGRDERQKRELTDRIIRDMEETIDATSDSISVSFEEISPKEWDEQVVKPDIIDKKAFLFKSPSYKSKYPIPKVDPSNG